MKSIKKKSKTASDSGKPLKRSPQAPVNAGVLYLKEEWVLHGNVETNVA